MRKLSLERLESLRPKIRKAYLDVVEERGEGVDYFYYLFRGIKDDMSEIKSMFENYSNRYRLTKIYAQNFEDYDSKLN
jgi:hypothetical protein